MDDERVIKLCKDIFLLGSGRVDDKDIFINVILSHAYPYQFRACFSFWFAELFNFMYNAFFRLQNLLMESVVQ